MQEAFWASILENARLWFGVKANIRDELPRHNIMSIKYKQNLSVNFSAGTKFHV